VSYQQQPRSSFQGACKWRFPLDILSPSVVGIRDRNNLHIHSDINMNMKQVEQILLPHHKRGKEKEKPTLWATMPQIKTVWTEETGRMLIAMRRALKEGTEGQVKRIE